MSAAEERPKVDGERLAELTQTELDRFREARPRSAELHRQAKRTLIGGVPMNRMTSGRRLLRSPVIRAAFRSLSRSPKAPN